MTEAILFIMAGLLALVGGGELLVRGASRLAALAGVAPLVIGLTVVAFGTSSPELAVSLKASLAGEADIAVGNVVGSNIFNVLFILGISALIVPLAVSRQLIRIDVPLMIGVSLLLIVLSLDGRLGRLDGLLLFGGLLIYIVWSIRQSRREASAANAQARNERATAANKGAGPVVLQIILIVAGLLLLTVGARWLVDGSVTIARAFRVSELLIGLTIIAVGTSLPEVAASIVAAAKGERDIAVGNVVGSNIFNIMSVLGLSAAISPEGVVVSPAALRLDIPIMTAVAVACLPIFFTGHVITRWEGALFFFYYWAYTAYLILAATNEAVSRTLAGVLLGFVVPLTVVTLIVGVARSLRQKTDRQV